MSISIILSLVVLISVALNHFKWFGKAPTLVKKAKLVGEIILVILAFYFSLKVASLLVLVLVAWGVVLYFKSSTFSAKISAWILKAINLLKIFHL